ncbi:MAG: thrombospondin type 3 repeat-containing protein [bacterium]
MKAPVLFLAVLVACSIAAPAAVHACTINEFGVLYLDSDCDGVIDNTDMSDADNDGQPDGDWVDNCRFVPNGNCSKDPVVNCDVDLACLQNNAQPGCMPSEKELTAGYQADWNHNNVGDACDDTDFDGVPDYLDNCKTAPNANQDPAACTDSDADGFEDPIDNCPIRYNPKQEDTDKDGVGDWCDNCRLIYNPAQNASACPMGSGSATTGTNNQPSPSESPPTGTNVVNNGPGQGPEEMQGNGLGEGGCALCVGQGSSPYAAVFFLLAALIILSRRRDTNS